MFCTYCSYIYLANNANYKDKITSLMLPTVFIYFITVAVGGIFMLIYGVSIDAMLACYSMDHVI